MIVEYTSDTPPEFDGIVMIDCWQPQEHETSKQIFFYRLSEYISQHADQYRQIINASMQCRFDYEDRSIINTLQTYCWDYVFDKNCSNTPNYYNTWILFNTFEQFRNSYQLFAGIRKRLRQLDTCYYLVTIEDFLSHWHARGPMRSQNWLVVGQSWQNCVHNNSLGLKQMAEVSKFHHMNFYVMEKFLLTEQDTAPTATDFSNDTLSWISYHGTDTYRLVPIK